MTDDSRITLYVTAAQLEMLTQAMEFMLANPEHADGVHGAEEYGDLYDKLHLTAIERSTDRSADDV